MGDDCRRRRPPLAGECGADRISGLPDELLHRILLCLGSARAAARTSVLSRSWRGVWSNLPKLFLSIDEESVSSFLDTVDAALAGYAAPTLELLSISMLGGHVPNVPAHRVAPWLRFASRRLVGELVMQVRRDMRSFVSSAVAGEEELELPAWGAAKAITLSLEGSWRLRVAGVFAALTVLHIYLARMEGGDLSALVSTQCPCLKMLHVFVTLIPVSDVFIHSDSLHTLHFFVENTRRLEVVAPVLEKLWLISYGAHHISAPKLADLSWYGWVYDHHQHQFAHISRRLRFLETILDPKLTPVKKQFDEVDELSLKIFIPLGIAGYQSFLSETNKLSKCETLKVFLAWNEHGLAPAILHLFRCCSSIKKLSMELRKISCGPSLRYSCPLGCPCRLAESCKIDNIALRSLEEVEINSFVGSHEEMEFVEQLSRCSAAVLKRLIINQITEPARPLTKEVCEKVRSMCSSSLNVKFYAMSDGKRVRFD